MRKSGILQKLAKVTATDKPFISIYLNAEANEHGKDEFDSFLKKQLSVHQEKFAEESEERESYDADMAKINEYAANIKPSANGVAIFACSAEDYFEVYEFSVPFEKNQFFTQSKPSIYPLARMIDQNPQFAVVLADSNSAKILVMQRGRILENEEIDNATQSRSEAGGWSQMRFQRHVDDIRQKHAKEVIDDLEKIVREEDIRQIVLAGNKDVVIPLLKEEMNDFLTERHVGTIRLEIEASDAEIMEAAESAIKQNDTLEDKEKIDMLNEENYDGGKGITGVAKTLQALANGQVQELYLTANFDELEYDEDAVSEILEHMHPVKMKKHRTKNIQDRLPMI